MRLKRSQGFLLAVRDCCVEKGSEYLVPEKINDELAGLAGLDLGAVEVAQRKQRIKRLMADLNLPEAEDRATAMEKLGR